MVKILISYKFRILNPSKTVQDRLEQTLRHCKDLYNAALQERRDAWKINRVSINYHAQSAQLSDIKVTNPEYKNIHSQVTQNVLKRVEKSFDNFFRRVKNGKGKVGFPRFQGANRYDSFTYPQSGFSLTHNKLTLSKIGKVKIKLSRQMVGRVKTCQIKRECGKWFVVFTVETMPEILPKTDAVVGIDAGNSYVFDALGRLANRKQSFLSSPLKSLCALLNVPFPERNAAAIIERKPSLNCERFTKKLKTAAPIFNTKFLPIS